MLTTFKDNSDLLKKFITGDKSLVYGYDIETKAQSFQWKNSEEPGTKKASQVRSNVVLLTVFFDCNGVVHHEFLPQGRTVKLCADCAKQFVRNAQNCGNLNHGFCKMIKHQLTHRCLCKSKTVIMSQLPHSLDLSPANFFLFPKLKTQMKGKRFAMIEEIKEKSKQVLTILKSLFQKCFEGFFI